MCTRVERTGHQQGERLVTKQMEDPAVVEWCRSFSALVDLFLFAASCVRHARTVPDLMSKPPNGPDRASYVLQFFLSAHNLCTRSDGSARLVSNDEGRSGLVQAQGKPNQSLALLPDRPMPFEPRVS